jgi:glucuronoarabinoxylan endo-1,4-beta-xylanase
MPSVRPRPRLLLAALCVSVLGIRPGLAEEAGAPAPPTVVVSAEPRQTLDGFGSSTAWYADEFADFAPAERAAMLRFLFDREAGLGLSIHRIRLDPDPAENRDGPPYDWSDARLGKQLALLREIQAAHAPRFLASPWTPPSWMKDNTSQKNGGRLLPEHYGRYAALLAEWTAGLRERGIPVSLLSLQNEPEEAKRWESCVWTPAELATFAGRHLAPALAARGLDLPLLANEFTQWDDRDLDALLAHPDAAAAPITHAAAHLYKKSHRRVRPFPGVAGRGLALWMTEFYVGDYLFPEKPVDETTRGLVLAAAVHDTLVVAEARAFLFWWSIAPPTKRPEGLITAWFEPPAQAPFTRWEPMPHAYFLGHYSRFLPPGSVRLAADTAALPAEVRLSAYLRPDGARVLVALNPAATPATLRVTLESPRAFHAFRTSAEERLAPVAPPAAEAAALVLALPPRSASTFLEAVAP